MSLPDLFSSSMLPLLRDVSSQHFPESALYVLATPIGNAGDITLRALQVLDLVDAVACEDTRNTGHLLQRYGFCKELIAAHEHNEREVAQQLLARLQAGQRIALVSDAGTPAVSDPGARIVDAMHAAGVRVVPLPGPSAALAGLSASGLLGGQFHFVGFLPARPAQRDAALQALRDLPAILIFYEAPHRIVQTVETLSRLFPPQRQLVIARELSKLFEEIHRGPVEDAPAWLAASAQRQKGEFVLLLEGAAAASEDDAQAAEAERILRILLESCPVSQAAALAARITGQKKKLLYQRALELQQG